jgi:hypothetical protein
VLTVPPASNRPPPSYEATRQIVLALEGGTFINRRDQSAPLGEKWLLEVVAYLKEPHGINNLYISTGDSNESYRLTLRVGDSAAIVVSLRLTDRGVELLDSSLVVA